ncbi:MAG: PAS domain-containing protein [Gallionella sp.]|nr:PAS domain-containing protein [Gallionella sp.]
MKSLPSLIATRGSFKRQIILAFAVGFFFLAAAFSAYQVKTEKAYLYLGSTDETISLAKSLAVSSRSWLLAYDLNGMQEVVHSFQSHPELRYAMVISPSGRVLAHTDTTKIGQFVSDEASLTLIKSPPENRVMIDDESLSDIAVPIMMDHRHIGWARVAQGREGIADNLHKMILSSALFVLMAVILSLFAALLIAKRLGYRVGYLVRVAEQVQAGDYATRADISGVDEIARLASSFNHMLDVLARDEAQLRESEALLQATMKILPVGIWIFDADGKIIFSNDAAQRIWAGARYVGIEQLGEYKGWRLDSKKQIEPHEWAGARALEKGETSIEEEIEIECFDGTHKIILDSAVPLRSSDGSIRGAITINHDITERKRAELEREQYFKFFSTSTDLMCIADPNGCFKKINPVCTQMLGYAEEELLAKPFIEFVHPDDRQSTLDEMARQMQLGFSLKFENRYLCKDGSFRWLSWNANYIKDEGITYATARDITESKAAKDTLREKEERLALATVNNGVGIWDWNLQTQQLIWDDSMYALYHIRREDFSGTEEAWRASLHPDDLNRGDKEVADAIAGKKPFETEFRVVWPNGEIRHIKAVAKVFRDAQGTPLRMLGINMDVSERRKAEMELRRSERGLSEAQRIAHLGNWELDLTSNMLIWSDEIYRIFEIDPEKFGASYDAFLNAIHPDDRELVNNAYSESVKSKIPYDIVHRLLMQDGRVKYVNEKCETHYGEDGKPLRSVGTVHDITERKKIEMELRELNNDFVTLLDNTGDFIYFKDKDSRIRFCSQTLANITGHSSWHDMIGKHDLEIFPADTAKIYYEEELPVFREGKPLLNKTVPYYDEQGRPGWVNTNKWPVFGDDKKTVVGIFGISRDITELKEAEDEINELNRDLERRVVERTAELEAANNELEAFSYSVSHDLRTPLRAIDGFSRILLDDYTDKLDDEGKRLLNVVRNNTERMSQLIDDILRFSRIGRAEISFAEVDMFGLVRDVLDELGTLIAGRKIQINFGELPKAMGDRAMLHQVIENLLNNAIKFTGKKDEARIDIGGRIDGDRAVYSVRDNGAGFDMQYADKLFGVFQRLHAVNEFEGTGIGLAIVKRIVSRHGGRVWAEGKVNEGATIYFALPIKGE